MRVRVARDRIVGPEADSSERMQNEGDGKRDMRPMAAGEWGEREVSR